MCVALNLQWIVLRWASSSISILRFVSITIQAAVIWLPGGREVLLVAIYRLSSSRSWWCSNLHSRLSTPTSILEITSGNTEEKKNCAEFQTRRQMLQQPLLDSAPSTETLEAPPWWVRGKPERACKWQRTAPSPPIPNHPITPPPPKTSQIKETHHNYHVPCAIETWRKSTHSNKPQPSLSHFSLLIFCLIFTLKCLGIWSEGERKQNKTSPKQTNEKPQQQTIQTKKTHHSVSMSQATETTTGYFCEASENKVLCDFRSFPATEL